MNKKYPEITVKLVGTNGNAFSVLAKVNEALRRGGAPKEDQEAFMNEATSGDYNHLLMTVHKWVNIE